MTIFLAFAAALLPTIDANSSVDRRTVASLSASPSRIELTDSLARQRLLVSGEIAGRQVDLTDVATFRVVDPAVAVVGPNAEVAPLRDGSTVIEITAAGKSTKVQLTTRNSQVERPIQFTNEVVSVFTRLGCNSGNCHGKAAGQNGFRLSLLGFESASDYDLLVKESRGRRLFPAAPERSLLLRKACGQSPHGGGKLMKPGDEDYQIVAAWIRQGMPQDEPNAAAIQRLSIDPPSVVMDRKASQRIRVVAHYSDGRKEDVTRRTTFQSNNDDVAAVEPNARIRTGMQTGEAAIMARYQGKIAVFRASVPTSTRGSATYPFVARNFIDELVSKKWRELGIAPSRPTTDAEFVRRIHLDLAGRLPTIEEAKTFVSDSRPDKRDRLIDELLNGPDYAALFAMKWGAILQNQRGERTDEATATHAFAAWIRDAVDRDVPYDVFVREIITSTGSPEVNPPVGWYRLQRTREETVDSFAQAFLGTRIQCARCHHHPYEKWGQDDYTGLASFFARVQRRREFRTMGGRAEEAVVVARNGVASHPRTGAALPPRGLDGKPLKVRPGEDPRVALADWLADPKNPFFAPALVNRMWGHFFARGIVDPIDDMRASNPPTNPELLDSLSARFIQGGYRIKPLIREIVRSSTYQLSSEPTDANRDDRQNFARYYPRRIPAEVLLDSLDQTTQTRANIGLPVEMRAIEAPDESTASYFLDVFGRPRRGSPCECERVSDASLGQSLHLMNSKEVQEKLAGGRAKSLASDKRPDSDKVVELYYSFYSRPPRPEELKIAVEHLQSQKDKFAAIQNLMWALANTKEFLFGL